MIFEQQTQSYRSEFPTYVQCSASWIQYLFKKSCYLNLTQDKMTQEQKEQVAMKQQLQL